MVLSNYSVPHVREYARDAGADGFLDKNSDLGALQEFCRAPARDQM